MYTLCSTELKQNNNNNHIKEMQWRICICNSCRNAESPRIQLHIINGFIYKKKGKIEYFDVHKKKRIEQHQILREKAHTLLSFVCSVISLLSVRIFG